MPSTIILTALVNIGVSVATVSLLAPAIIFGSRLLVGYVVSRLFTKGSNSNQRTSDGSRVQLPPATNNKLPITYGTSWIRPVITDAKISTDQKTMWYVCSLTEVPDSSSGFGGGTISLPQIQWADKTLNFDPTDPTKVISWTNGNNETDTRVNGLINVYRYRDGSNNFTGGTTQSAITILSDSSIDPSQRWTSTDLMSKTAFIVVKVQYNQEIGLTGLEQLTVKVVNTLSDPGGVVYDYLTNSRYGCDIPTSSINTQSLQDLSAYSSQQITYTLQNGGTGTINRYAINGPLDTGTDCFQNLQTIMDACDSWLQWNEALGQWGVVINKGYDQTAGSQTAQTISNLFNLTDDVVIGAINLNPVDLNSTYNRIEVSYPDTNIYDQAGFSYVDLDTGDRNPNEPDNLLNMQLPVVNNSVQAQYIATRKLIQSREDLVVQCTVDYSGIQIDAGDLVRFNSAKFQWVNKVFRVTQVQEGKDDSGFLSVSLTLVEYNPQVYQNINITQFIPSPNTGITDPTIAATPQQPTITNITQTSDVPNFNINAVLPLIGTYGAVEIYYSSNGDVQANYQLLKTLLPTAGSSFVSGSTVTYNVTQLTAGTYYFKVRVITTTGSKSPYSIASSPLIWSPTVTVPSQAGTNFEWSPSSLVVPADSTGNTTTVGQVGSLYLRVGPDIVQLWDGVTPATQPSNTWYANSISSTTGLTTSSLQYDTSTDRVFFSVSSMANNTDQGIVTIGNAVYRPPTGNTIPLGTSAIQVTKVKSGANGNTGTSGTQYSSAVLYQWSPTLPGNTSGQSTYNWLTSTNSSYTGGNNWTINVPTNPGTSGIRLWSATRSLSAAGGTTTSTVNWNDTANVSIADISQNGSNGSPGVSGVQTAKPRLYQWTSGSTPTISGTNSYRWSDGVIVPNSPAPEYPSGWSVTLPTSPSQGFTLWAAEATLVASANATTTTINWSSSSILAIGYSGINGGPGSPGNTGSSARVAYSRITGSPTPTSGTITVSGDGRPSSTQSNTTWGLNYSWTATDPNPSSTDSLYTTTGIYNPVTNQTVWDTPYLASLRVGVLSAITTNTGNLTVQDTMTVNTAGKIRGGQTSWNVGNGFFMGYETGQYRFSIGDGNAKSLTWDGSTMRVGSNLFIGDTCSVGNGLSVGNNMFVGVGLTVGDYAKIGNNLTVANNAIIGNNLTVGNNATLGGNLTLNSVNASGNVVVGTTGAVRGGQTGYNAGSGFFLGFDPSANKYRLSIGDPNGSHLLWDGDRLTLNIASNAIIQTGLISAGVFASDYQSSGSAVATVDYNNDGTLVSSEGPTFWYSPGTTGIGSNYDIYMVPSGSVQIFGGSWVTWQRFTSNITFMTTSTNGENFGTVNIQYRANGTTQVLPQSTVVNLSAIVGIIP